MRGDAVKHVAIERVEQLAAARANVDDDDDVDESQAHAESDEDGRVVSHHDEVVHDAAHEFGVKVERRVPRL